MLTLIWYQVFQSNTNNLHTLIQYEVFLSNTNNFHTVVWFQVFLFDTNNYIILSNYFYLLIVICLHTIIEFQVSNNNNNP